MPNAQRIGLGIVLLACGGYYLSQSRHTAIDTTTNDVSPRVSQSVQVGENRIDLSELMRRTHLAFQRRGGAFIGGDMKYGVSVRNDVIAIHPDAGTSDTSGNALESTALELHTKSLTRGASTAVGHPYELDPAGVLAANDRLAIETIKNTPAGLEQSWLFDSRPEGNGDLEIRIAFAGEQYVGSTASGIHFRDETTGLGLVYGVGTWVDRDGARSQIGIEVSDHDIVLRVPARTLDESRYPAVLDPTIGSELNVDFVDDNEAYQQQFAPAVGHSGIQGLEFLVVWQDYRRVEGSLLGYDIYGAHVNSLGQIQDVVGFLITDPDEGGDHIAPAIFYDSFVPAYILSYANLKTRTINVRVLDGFSTATPLMSDDLPVNPFAQGYSFGNPRQTDITFNSYSGSNHTEFVAWADVGGTTPGTWGGAFQITGIHPLRISPLPFAQFEQNAVSVHVANSNPFSVGIAQDFLVVSTNPSNPLRNVEGRLYDSGGNLVNAFPILINPPSGFYWNNASAGYFGSTNSWLVAADYGGNAIARDVFALEVDMNGVVYPQTAIATGPDTQEVPTIAGHGANGNTALLAWTDAAVTSSIGAVETMRISTTNHVLTLLDPSPVLIGGSINPGFGGVALHSDEDHNAYLLAWNDFGVSSSDNRLSRIYSAREDYSGFKLGSAVLVSSSVSRETLPSVAYCGGTYLVAWTDTKRAQLVTNISAVILSSSGAFLHGVLMPVSSGSQDKASVGCNGSNFYVVWTDYRNGNADIYGTGVDQNGTVLNAGGVPIANTSAAEDNASIAYAGGYYWVVFDWGSQKIFGTRLNASTGLVNIPAQLLTNDDRIDVYPDIDSDGTNFFVVYQSNRGTSGIDIFAKSLTVAGVVGAELVLENNTGDQRYPHMRWDGVGYYQVAYEDDHLLATNGTDITGRLLKPNGTILSRVGIAVTTGNEYAPRLARRNGSQVEVSYWLKPQNSAFEYDVYGQSMNNGAVSGARFAISALNVVREMTPGIACSSTTSCFVPYRSFNAAATFFESDRIQARVLTYP